ncbi:MAG: divergent polysaccharide deacetylase family protein [Alphaproteobacteria bacterium]|nr:divergent polysaccharide deacetylase family protein [Alphaproteobacteria bacterium]MCW5740059.1 divergent polysaccharide deacetylase family protein [Alphaproteobacteria bacterium]
MAASKGRTRKSGGGKTRARKGKSRKAAPATIGARLDEALAAVGAYGRGLFDAMLARRLAFGALALLCLAVLGIGGGFWLTGILNGPRPSPPATIAAKPEPSRPAPTTSRPSPPPRYASIEQVPGLPVYSESEGKPQPNYEERRAPPSTPRAAPAGAAWQRNAIAFSDDRRRPLIVVVIDDMGLDRPRSRRITELPRPLTLSYLPYARNLAEQATAARGRGHELMLHLPMEPLSRGVDPGPNALLTNLSLDMIRRRTVAALDSFSGYVAVNNHMGSRFTTWRPGVEVSLREMKTRGLAFLDSRTHADTVGGLVAEELGMPNVDRHVFLDDVMAIDAVRRQLAETEVLARRQGFAVAIGHPHDVTIQALAEWLPGLSGKGFVLGPISAAIRRRGWQ